MFQTFFPALPEFQGRQVVTLHNQRDFLFFRRHRYVYAPYAPSSILSYFTFTPQMRPLFTVCGMIRLRYAFRTPEKVALQEIGPRFTLKLRSLKKGLPAVKALGEAPPALEFDNFDDVDEEMAAEERAAADAAAGDGTEMGAAGAGGEDAEMGEGEGEGEGEEEAKEEEETGKDKGKDAKRKPPKGEEFEWVWKVCDCSSPLQ